MGRETLQSALGLSDRKSFRERYLKPAVADGLIEMTIPDKPNSRLRFCARKVLTGISAGWRNPSMRRKKRGLPR